METRDPIPDSMHGYSAFYGHMPPFRRLPEQADEFFGVKGSIDPDPVLRKYYGGTMDDEEFDDITLQDRIRHLRQLLQQDCCHLTIISDDNPLLNLKELRLSIYLSGNIGIMVALVEDKNTIIRLRSPRLVGYFNKFFKHSQQLDPEYCTTGEDAFSLIRHVLARIDPDAS